MAEVKSFYHKDDIKTSSSRSSLDLLIKDRAQIIAVELKYKTAYAGIVNTASDEYSIPREGAQDISRYSFLSDLERLERSISRNEGLMGYAMMLTNDPLYWTPPKRITLDAQFRLHPERQEISERMSWRKGTSKSTKKNRESSIVLKGKYPLKWRYYSEIQSAKNSEFRYLLIKIEK